jgi:DNA polymerase III sliding clamp (beta) subunit (PCNA family)
MARGSYRNEDKMIELKIQQESLAVALNVVTRASKPNSLAPVFELVRLEASAGRLVLSCFNGEFAACGSLPA